MFCGKCGTKLPDDAMFCGECGAPTRYYRERHSAQEQQPYDAPQYEQKQPEMPPYRPYGDQKANQMPFYDQQADVKKKFSGGGRKVIITVIALILIGVAAVLLYNFLPKPSSPERTIEKLEQAVKNLDVDSYVECFDKSIRDEYEEVMENEGAQALTNGVLGIAGKLGIKPKVAFKIQDIDYTDKTHCRVSVDYSIEFFGQSQEDSVEIEMIKEDGEWVISSDSGDLLGGF